MHQNHFGLEEQTKMHMKCTNTKLCMNCIYSSSNNMCMCDCLQILTIKKSYINSVIAGMIVSAAVNQKKRKNGKIAQFLPVPVANSIRYG